MTKKIFEFDVYKKEHIATVVDIKDEDKIVVVLDETIFFPVGGGQSADKGTIDGINVSDVYEKDNIIYHVLDSKPENKTVELKIDYQKRFDDMQQHCGEHILSGVIKSLYDGNNKGFHLGEEFVTIDVDIKSITDDMIKEIEEKSNDAIYSNIEIDIDTYDDESELEQYDLRKNITVDEDIRIVSILGVDCIACCGTHPSRTGEVGILKIYRTEKNKNMTRIYFKCGKRAFKDFQVKSDIVKELNKIYSSDDKTLLNKFNKEKEKNEVIKKEFIELKRNQLDKIIEDNIEEKNDLFDMIFDDISSNDMNYIIKKISKKRDVISFLYSKSEKKVILSYSGNDKLHCGELFKNIKFFGGKGGGNKKMAQGIFDDLEDGLNFFSSIYKILKK